MYCISNHRDDPHKSFRSTHKHLIVLICAAMTFHKINLSIHGVLIILYKNYKIINVAFQGQWKQMPKQMPKQILSIKYEHNISKNPIWQEADPLAI